MNYSAQPTEPHFIVQVRQFIQTTASQVKATPPRTVLIVAAIFVFGWSIAAIAAFGAGGRVHGEAQIHIPTILGVGGGLLSTLVAVVVWSLAQSQSGATTLAEEMTAQLRSTTELLENFIKHTPAAVAVLDKNLCYLQVSERWLSDYNLGDINVIGKCHYDVFPEIPERWRAIHQRALGGSTEKCDEDPFERADGTTDWLAWEVRPWRDRNGAIGGLIFFTQVITQRKRVETELICARVAAEAASRSKSEFLANMSHEIRTPLTAIMGYAELLREDGILERAPQSRIEAIDTICNAGQHLMTVINDILDLSKIQADKMTVEHIETPVLQLVTEALGFMRPRALEKDLEISAVLTSPIPDRIYGDPTRLRQVLLNLIGNAVKFTQTGGVKIEVGVKEQDGKQVLVIDVIDTGPGMTKEQAGRLFSAFNQADESVTRAHGGTGLGLVISQRLAGLMGGSVTLQRTAPGVGSCFRLTLNLVAVEGAKVVHDLELVTSAERENPSDVVPTLKGRILLAEDGPDNQRLICFHLRRAGAEVVVAENGQAALELLASSAIDNNPFDLLLTDIQMPEMDGYTLTRTLRAQGSSLPIIALTAHAMSEDRAKCLDVGCNDYATKPIDRVHLLRACAKWLNRTGSSSEKRAA